MKFSMFQAQHIFQTVTMQNISQMIRINICFRKSYLKLEKFILHSVKKTEVP